MTIIRRTIKCESCGTSVTMYDEKCPSCNSDFEPAEAFIHRLPGSRSNEHALEDSELIKPFVDFYLSFHSVRPRDIDNLFPVLEILRDHKYKFRDYILETMSLSLHMRSICQVDTKDRRETYLEILKRLEAIYTSLTT